MDIRIQHIKIIKKSDIPHFYQEMLLTFSFNENLNSLVYRLENMRGGVHSTYSLPDSEWVLTTDKSCTQVCLHLITEKNVCIVYDQSQVC